MRSIAWISLFIAGWSPAAADPNWSSRPVPLGARAVIDEYYGAINSRDRVRLWRCLTKETRLHVYGATLDDLARPSDDFLEQQRDLESVIPVGVRLRHAVVGWEPERPGYCWVFVSHDPQDTRLESGRGHLLRQTEEGWKIDFKRVVDAARRVGEAIARDWKRGTVPAGRVPVRR